MKKLSLTLFGLISFLSSFGTHIVGGGFSMQSEGNYQYKFSLTLYFDLINGNAGALDEKVTFTFFSKVSNSMVNQQVAIRVEDFKLIPYSLSSCQNQNIQTRIVTYELVTTLSPNFYIEPEGYYVSWERCCRNAAITNIIDPGSQGQAFLMFFPPVTKNGQIFENDSPEFGPVPNKIFSLGQLSQLNFSATDFDGDSLVYSLTNPLKGNSSVTKPILDSVFPLPYPPVTWSTGFSSLVQIPGNPDLTIDPQTGILSVKPIVTGLFVFGLKVEEYRNGVKIGEVRREFQQMVIDIPVNTPPKMALYNPVNYKKIHDGDTIYIDNPNPVPVCIPAKAVDAQVGQIIKARISQVNFDLLAVSGDTVATVANPVDSMNFLLCIPGCMSSSAENPFYIKVRVFDNGCSGELADSISFFLVMSGPFIPRPQIVIDNPLAEIIAFSEDNIQLKIKTNFKSTTDTGMIHLAISDKRMKKLQSPPVGTKFSAGRDAEFYSTADYEWQPDCVPVYNQPLTLFFKVNTTYCGQLVSVKNSIKITVNNTSDQISVLQRVLIDGVPLENVKISTKPGEILKTRIRLPGNTDGRKLSFNVPPVFQSFLQMNLIESNSEYIEKELIWKPDCSLPTSDYADQEFILFSKNGVCANANSKTIPILFDLEMNPLIAPIVLVNGLVSENVTLSAKTGSQATARIRLMTKDLNRKIELKVPQNYASFLQIENLGSTPEYMEQELIWKPDCSISNSVYLQGAMLYSKTGYCSSNRLDSVPVNLSMKGSDLKVELYDNFITVNGDGKNESFTISSFVKDFGCNEEFKSFEVFDRWGKKVFHSNAPNFSWPSGDEKISGFTHFFELNLRDSKFHGVLNCISDR